MNKLAVASVLLLGSASVLASTSYYQADVIESIPVYRTVETSIPQQQCWQEEVVRTERHDGYRSSTPSILGAVIGGALGNAVGHNKSNKRVGAVVGAVIGGSIGRDIGKQNRGQATVYHDTVEHCKTVYDHREEQKLVGYDVLYGYNGREYSVRLDRDPGATLRVKVNVEPVL